MDPVSIALGVAFPMLFFTGLGLALASVSHTAYLVAKASFCFATLDLAVLLIWWLYTTESAAWKTAVGAAFGLAIVASLPEILRWVDGNEVTVITERGKRLNEQLTDLMPIIEALRQNQQALAQAQHAQQLAGMLLSSFDNLQKAIDQRGSASNARQAEDRLAVAEHIIRELKIILENVRTFKMPEGQGLIIKTAPNTFDITFPVPMRIPPNLTFSNLPAGTTPEISNKTNIGFTVIFRPLAIPVEQFGLAASAEL